MMPELLEDQHDPVFFSFAGGNYKIMYDSTRTASFIHPPRWFVQRSDLRTTERFYSSPVGAFTAVYTGSASWKS